MRENHKAGGGGQESGVSEEAGPKIAALPELSELEKACARVVELEGMTLQQAGELKQVHDRCQALEKAYDEAVAKVRSIEENTLIQALSSLDAGADLAQFGEDMERLVTNVATVGAKGALKLTIGVKPMEGKVNALVVSAACALTLPKEAASPALFFPLEGGKLSRKDPRQKEFKFSRGDRGGDGDPGGYEDEEAAERKAKRSGGGK